MEIRKEFSFKGTHIVRNCSSDRCKYSIHGHLYVVEVFLSPIPEYGKAEILDNGQMVYDFGLMKTTLKDFVKLFDNTYALWNKEPESFKQNIKEVGSRWIELPCSPSAESLSLLFLSAAKRIIKNTTTKNGEQRLFVSRVKVHETRTGYAEASHMDVIADSELYNPSNIILSEALSNSISDEMKAVVLDNTGTIINKIVEQQV